MESSPSGNLNYRTEHGILVVTITEAKIQGEDIADTLRREMLAILDSSGATRIVIDFQHAQYISSAAFRPLLAVHRKLQNRGGRIVLCGLSPAVGDIFYTTRMTGPTGSITRMTGESGTITPLFDTAKDAEEAVSRLRSAEQASAPGPG